jgi:3-phenylpropionate/trans-cinnamate dioxygenase ferredoxin subunit
MSETGTASGTRQVLCAVDEIEPGTARRFDIGKHRIALIRCDDDFYAIGDRCTHADISLSEGDVYCDEREVECWKHGSTFSLVDGEPQSLPATRPTPVYEVEVVDGDVVVTLP